jgi:4-carboxymuconolactone decarboxylase
LLEQRKPVGVLEHPHPLRVRIESKEVSMRLPMIKPDELSPAQRALYDRFEAMVSDDAYTGFEVKRPDGAYTGPWGVLIHFPELARPLGEFVDLAQKLPGLSERERQIVILTIGARFGSAYEMYAHEALAAQAGLRADQIATLCAGGRPSGLSTSEADVASCLARGGVLPGPLYDTVAGTLGQDTLDAIVFVTIHYLAIGTLLNAYDVQAGPPTAQTTAA